MNRHPNSIEEFLVTPYFERQFVSFLTDGPPQVAGTEGPIQVQIAVPFGGGAAVILRFDPQAIYNLLQRVWRTHRVGVPLSLLPWSWAAHLHLPPGNPRPRILYAGHPTNPETYIPIADFHRFSFEHKFAELLSILMRLGARQITALHIKGWGSEIVASSAMALPHMTPNVGAEWGKFRHQAQQVIFTMELEGSTNPELPDNLVWYYFEPTWRSIVDGRTCHGLKKNTSVELRYNDDYGINSELRANVERSGFQISGSFETYQDTIWRIEVRF